MIKTGSKIRVKNTVNSVYAGDTGIVLKIVILATENPVQENTVFVAFEGGKSTEWFHEDALELV